MIIQSGYYFRVETLTVFNQIFLYTGTRKENAIQIDTEQDESLLLATDPSLETLEEIPDMER